MTRRGHRSRASGAAVGRLRPFAPSDIAALFQICLQTGAHGRDATPNCTDPKLLGSYFAVPYAVYDPHLCLILEDDDGACGYVLGTDDTRKFVTWFNKTWLPQIRQQFAGIEAKPDSADGWVIELLAKNQSVPDFVDRYPAHLHIDIIQRAQQRGWGRRMIEAWCARVRERGACGVHLGVSKHNTNATAFYRRIGMHEIAAEAWGWHLGLTFSPCPAGDPKSTPQRHLIESDD